MFDIKKILLVSTAATTILSGSMLSTAYAEESTAQVTNESAAASSDAYVLSDLDKFYLASAAYCKAQGVTVPDDVATAATEIYGSHTVEAEAYLQSLSGSADSLASVKDETATATGTDTTAVTDASVQTTATDTAVSTQYVEQEDGTYLFYTVDPLTGSAVELYDGWFTNSNGERNYFEDGKMVAGWIIDDGKFYYIDPSTGAMVTSQLAGNFYLGEDGAALMDTTTPDGVKLAYNGSIIKAKSPVEELNEKTYIYRDLLVKNPDLYAEFSPRSSGNYQIMPEKENGFAWYTYATMKLYSRKADGSMGSKVYEGDGCFRTDAVIEVKESDGTITTMSPSGIIGSDHEIWMADHIHIDPAGFISYSAAQK